VGDARPSPYRVLSVALGRRAWRASRPRMVMNVGRRCQRASVFYQSGPQRIRGCRRGPPARRHRVDDWVGPRGTPPSLHADAVLGRGGRASGVLWHSRRGRGRAVPTPLPAAPVPVGPLCTCLSACAACACPSSPYSNRDFPDHHLAGYGFRSSQCYRGRQHRGCLSSRSSTTRLGVAPTRAPSRPAEYRRVSPSISPLAHACMWISGRSLIR